MLHNYLPVLLFLMVSIALALVLLAASKTVAWLLKTNRPHKEKLSAFECGFEPFEDARMKFDVRFYLVAILFIVFDLEMAFLFPWATIVHKMSWSAFVAMGIFLLILLLGFIYEWKKGALEWE